MDTTAPSRADVAGFRAAAVLDRYEEELESLMAAGERRQDWGRLQCELGELRKVFAGLPALWAPWLALLISHFELLDAITRGDANLDGLARAHQARLDRLARGCRELCAPGMR